MKRVPALSIIVPTFNEEKYLPRLLDSIRKQDFKDFEVIVSDAPSKDNTAALAKKFGCRVVMPGALPSIARNRGAAVAKGRLFLFVDADNVLPRGFVSSLLGKFEEKACACASVFYEPLTSRLIDKAGFFVYNAMCWLLQGIKPAAAGWCIVIKADVFRKIGGFDGSLRIGEDFDLVQRARRCGRFAFFISPRILVSTRRLDKEGRAHYFVKSILSVLLYHGIGKKRIQKVVPYEFGRF